MKTKRNTNPFLIATASCVLAFSAHLSSAQTFNNNGLIRATNGHDVQATGDLIANRNLVLNGWSGAGAGNITAHANIVSNFGFIRAGSYLQSQGYLSTATHAGIGTYLTTGSHASIGTNLNVGTSASGGALRVGNGTALFGPTTTTTGTAKHALAVGVAAEANSFSSVVVGRFNQTGGNASQWVATDPLFVVANGDDANNRNNAFTVKKNGDIILGKAQGDILMGQFGQ